MKAIELKPTDLLAVSIPKEYSGYKDFKVSSTGYVCYKLQNVWQAIPPRLMDGFYTLLGSVTAEHIDFDPEPYVDKTKHYTWGGYGYAKTEDVLVNYMHIDVSICRSPDASFRSLLTANDVHFVNPYKKPKAIDYGGFSEFYKDALACYKEVESKLVEKILILKPL